MEPQSTFDTFLAYAKNPRIASTTVVAFGVVLASVAYTGTLCGISAKLCADTKVSSAKNPASPAQKLAETDENGNGIPDWQELKLADTEGLDAGDADTNTGEGDGRARKELANTYTKTERLAGDLFGVYLERKEAGAYSEADNGAIIANALAALDIDNFPRYTRESLTVTPDATTTNGKEKAAAIYRDSVAEIVKNLDAIGEYELATYARATEKNSVEEFKKVSDAADVYATAVENLKKMSVPSGAVEAHLALMNSFAKLSLALLEMSKGYDDIAGSYAALKTFGDAEKEVEAAYGLQRVYLAIHNAIEL